jgi:D-alanyl-D-alanine carboxypeptidase
VSELLVDPDELERRVVAGGEIRHRGTHGVAQAPLDPETLGVQPKRIGIAGRERMLDGVSRRPSRAGGWVEQRPDLGLEQGERIGHRGTPDRIIRRRSTRDMGREAHSHLPSGPLLPALAVVLALLLVTPAQAAEPTLRSRLDRALRVPNVDLARTAALAVDLRTGAVVYSRNPSLSLLPASNEKVPVVYAALALLGGGYRFHTEVVGTGTQVGDVWDGNLFLRGYGDPTLETSDLARLAAEVASWGIRHVTGAVVGDESWFDTRRTAPGWKAKFYIRESPALAAAALFRQALETAGITVAKPSRSRALTQSGLPLARDVSVPLAEIVRFMGRESDNYTAEILVKQLGALEAEHGSTAAGLRVVRRVLAAAGVPLAGVRLADGSGLSSLDRLTAGAIVALLEAGLADVAIRDAFVASLAVAGVDGTLKGRMRSRPARGRVIAKTGTTSAASALSGFVRGRYAFAILQNGGPVSSFWARRAQDQFATILAAVQLG